MASPHNACRLSSIEEGDERGGVLVEEGDEPKILHAMLHEAHERSPRTALTPIPEAPECSGKPDLESGPSPSERRVSNLSDAMAPRPIVSTADERAERAAKRAAVERELPAWRSVKEFPAHREAFGRLTLRASDDPQAEGVRAVCRVRDGALTLGLEKRAASGEWTEKVVAEVPLEALAVGMRRGRANMLTIATVHGNNLFDEIYCVCDDPARRNRWIAIFRGMGVAIFDLRN